MTSEERSGRIVSDEDEPAEATADQTPAAFVFQASESGDVPLRLDESLPLKADTGTIIIDDVTDETSCEALSASSQEAAELGHTVVEEMAPPPPHHHDNLWHDLLWLSICFVGIMASFVAYGILLEYATSGDRRLHELSFLFVTSVLAAITAWTGRTIKQEEISDIPKNRFLLLGLMSLGSTFCAIRALRYVIFPIQVLARSCKPVPVLLIGTLLGKKYPRRKHISVFLVVCGVAMFMGGGNILKGGSGSEDSSDDSSDAVAFANTTELTGGADSIASSLDNDTEEGATPLHLQIIGVTLLTASLFFDGGTGAYEDKLMSMHSVEPFDLMLKFQVSKALLSGLILTVFNQWHLFMDMLEKMGIYIFALGMCSAIGQVFIFITIAKFGALTASLMSLTRKVTTLTASIVIYHHDLTGVQLAGLIIAVGAMFMNFVRKKATGMTPSESPKETAVRAAPDRATKAKYSSVPNNPGDQEIV